MKPIKVTYQDNGTKWGLWVDTSGREAIIIPIGTPDPVPVSKALVNIKIIRAQNPDLELDPPRV